MKKTYPILLFLLSFIISFPALSEGYPEASFDSPRATFRYFLKTMKGHKLGDDKALDLAIKALDLSHFDSNSREISGKTAAIKLINTLDRLEFVQYEDIPLKPKGNTWVYKKLKTQVDGGAASLQISVSQNKQGLWLFDRKTIKNIALFERLVKDKKVASGVTAYDSWRERIKRGMPAWTAKRTFVLLNGQWIALLALIFLSFLTERIIRFILLNILIEFLAKKGVRISDELREKLSFPLGLTIFAVFWSLGVRFLEFQDGTLSWLLRGGQVVFTVALMMAIYQLVDFVCLYLEKKAFESENKFDDILIPLIRKSSKTFVVAVGIIAVGDSLNLDMKGLLAGMGIAGLGVSLAAKDTLSNLFGSLTVLLDRPFRIGDWVIIDGKIEGTVEEVGLRSCRIRTFHNSLITIPNGLLTNASIDNLGMREYRRFSTTLGVQYDTPPEKVEAFCEGIRQVIREHPHTRKDYFNVYLNNLGAHSLDIILYVFFKCPDWSEELNQRHRLLIDILRLGSEMGVEFAFPTQTLHMISGESVKYDGLPLQDQIDLYAKERAQGIVEKPISPPQARSSL